jgi:hypothetical protein
MLRFQVVTFGPPNTTDETALRFYDFKLDVLGPQPEHTYFLSMNTLPSNTSNSYFPGVFHSEPSSRLLALEVETPVTDFILGGDIPLHVLYVPHDVLLGHIMAHPPDADTVVVPWEEWGHGNAHIFTLPEPSPDRFLGSKIVCGMHAMTEPPMVMVQGDQKILRIMDYHPRRIARNPVTQGGAVDPHDTAAWQKAGVSTDEKIPYAFKDIPLPSGLRLENIKIVLGEDVVAVFEVSTKNRLTAWYEGAYTDQVFHGYFQRFWSQDRESVLSPHIVRGVIGDASPWSRTSEPEASVSTEHKTRRRARGVCLLTRSSRRHLPFPLITKHAVMLYEKTRTFLKLVINICACEAATPHPPLCLLTFHVPSSSLFLIVYVSPWDDLLYITHYGKAHGHITRWD